MLFTVYSLFNLCQLVIYFVLQLNLMKEVRESIKEDRFPEFIDKFMDTLYPKGDFPKWAVDALQSVGITLKKPGDIV